MPDPHPRRLPSLGAGVLGLSLTLLTAACSGGSSTDLSAPPTTANPTTTASIIGGAAPTTLAPTTTAMDPAVSSSIAEATAAEAAGDGAAMAESMIPSAPVTDISTGEAVDFASIAPADTPILLWMWAPH